MLLFLKNKSLVDIIRLLFVFVSSLSFFSSVLSSSLLSSSLLSPSLSNVNHSNSSKIKQQLNLCLDYSFRPDLFYTDRDNKDRSSVSSSSLSSLLSVSLPSDHDDDDDDDHDDNDDDDTDAITASIFDTPSPSSSWKQNILTHVQQHISSLQSKKIQLQRQQQQQQQQQLLHQSSSPSSLSMDQLMKTSIVDTTRDHSCVTNLCLDVDVSSCCLGDAGILQVMDIFCNIDFLSDLQAQLVMSLSDSASDFDLPSTSDLAIDMTLRSNMNRLTGPGASKLIQAILLLQYQRREQFLEQIEEEKQEKKEVDNDTMTLQDENNIKLAMNHSSHPYNNNNNITKHTTLYNHKIFFYIQELDLGFNDLGKNLMSVSSSKRKNKHNMNPFFSSLQTLIQDEDGIGTCPTILRLHTCGLGSQACRFIGKGIVKSASLQVQRIQNKKNTEEKNEYHHSYFTRPPLQLYLSGNEHIGDSGAAALAAALKMSPRISLSQPVVHTLDLSSCGIGDIGVEALATAIQANPGCIHVLDLSNNLITDEGAIILAQALQQSYHYQNHNNNHHLGESSIILQHLDLSNNKYIGNKGLLELSLAMECQALQQLSLRSCSVQAEGVSALGNMIHSLASKRKSSISSSSSSSAFGIPIEIDLSGNSFGSLREKDKSGIASYSASLLKSKASATTASYLNFIGKKIKSGLKDAGLDIEDLLPTQDQSDDEEEEVGDRGVDHSTGNFKDPNELDLDWENDAIDIASKYSAPRCGARAFADSIFEDHKRDELSLESTVEEKSPAYCFRLGMRFCSLDSSAIEALAAAKLFLQEQYHADVHIDVGMNKNIDSNIVRALRGEPSSLDESTLKEMSQRYMEAREIIQKARERAKQVADAETARLKAEDAISGMMGDEEEEEEFYDQDVNDLR